ncbi:MAG TPA: DegQ family serine endoprotease [Phycisphaerae bacterium]|nr:DegQ family serine endoprotease [Phycisphaerae bacterium]HRW52582.1 DegQ family serine endoprotease [Phycisphaerae bacterium]
MIKVHKRIAGNIALVACVGVAALLVGSGVAPVRAHDRGSDASRDESLRYANALSDAFAGAAEEIQPSVVSIRAVRHFKPIAHSPQGFGETPGRLPFDDQLLQRFFGGRMTPQPAPDQQGLGSGVIVSDDGYILTNNHVAGDADELVVEMRDGKQYPAKVVGVDPMTDLAVIQVDARGLKAAQMGDSDGLRVGEWVVAAGNPFGLTDTITAGIVSAKGRANVRIADYEDFIQTDAAINPGNSGGPLVDLNGRVVGINTAIASRSGGNNGVGFAIPINMARSIMDSLIHDGKVVRGWLGVSIQPLDESLAKSFGYDSAQGVLIGDVLQDGPAAKSGLKAGDIVMKYDGADVSDITNLRNRIAATKPGSTVTFEVFRDGTTKSVDVEIGKMKGDHIAMATPELRADLGMTLSDLSAQMASSMGLADTNGVLVASLDPGGAAARSGLRTNDIILAIRDKPVDNVRSLERELAQSDLKSGVRLTVQTGDMKHFVMLLAPGN